MLRNETSNSYYTFVVSPQSTVVRYRKAGNVGWPTNKSLWWKIMNKIK